MNNLNCQTNLLKRPYITASLVCFALFSVYISLTAFVSYEEDRSSAEAYASAYDFMCSDSTFSLSCVGLVNVTLAPDCTSDLDIHDVLLAVPPQVDTNMLELIITDSEGNYHGNMFDNDDVGKEFTASVGIIGCPEQSCWAKINIELKYLPEFDSPCEFISGREVTETIHVRDSMFVKLDSNGDVEEYLGSDTMTLATIEVDSLCQKLTLDMSTDLKSFSFEHSTGDFDWDYDSVFWDLRYLDPVVTGSGTSVGSGTFLSGGFAEYCPTLPASGTYEVKVAIMGTPPDSNFLTTEGPSGMITATLSTTNCILGDCETWCPSEATPDSIRTLAEIQAELAAQPCFSDIQVTEIRSVLGDVCDDDGQLVLITHNATVQLPHDQGEEKRIVLQQVYSITQPTGAKLFARPGNNLIDNSCPGRLNATSSNLKANSNVPISNCPVELSCGDDTDPKAIYEKLLARELQTFTTFDSSILAGKRIWAAGASFPFIYNLHDVEKRTFALPEITEHKVISEERQMKVLKFFNTETNTFIDTACVINDITCKPVWTKVTIIDKSLKEVTKPGGDTTLFVTPIVPIIGQDHLCGYSSTYSDTEFPACGGGTKIQRTWSTFDWCGGSIVGGSEVGQIIVLKDDIPPVVEVPIMDMNLSVDPWKCVKTFEIEEEGIAIDECSGEVTYQWSAPGAMVDGNKITVWLGETITVTGTISDECGNYTTTSFDVEVVDGIPPTAIAEDRVNVTITGGQDIDSQAKIFVDAIDAGSHDAGCGEVTRCLLRQEDYNAGLVMLPGGVSVSTDGSNPYFREEEKPLKVTIDDVEYETYNASNSCYAESYTEYYHDKFGNVIDSKTFQYVTCNSYIKLCCDDIGSDGQKVIMFVEDEYGNRSSSWTTVVVEDKPDGWVCYDATVYCTDLDSWEPPIPSYGGQLCPNYTVKEHKREFNVVCGEGTLEITWVAIDESGNEASKAVCIYPVDRPSSYSFDPTTIKWPKHYDGQTYDGINKECDGTSVHTEDKDGIQMGDVWDCQPGEPLGEPIWCLSDCDLILSSYEDEAVPGSATCGKVIRRWTVIDWCTWDPNSGGAPDDANDSSVDVFQAVEDWTLGEICEECDKWSSTPDNIYFEYKEVDVDGYYTFDQIFKLDDQDPPIITAPEVVITTDGGNTSKDNPDYSGCIASGTATVSVLDDCMGISSDGGLRIQWSFQGEDGFGSSVDLVDLPGGYYTIYWTAQDACGNVAEAEQTVHVKDLKKPTPVCRQDISTATMNSDGSTIVWAQDFDLGSFDNCSEVHVYFKDEDGNQVPSLTFSCDVLEGADYKMIPLQVFVGDDEGNEDFCNVNVRIDDAQDNCPDSNQGTAVIAGEIRNEAGDMVESAEVMLNRYDFDMTGVEGQYAFMNNPINNQYQIEGNKDDDHLNGVSSLDLVLIQRHILGIQQLDGPYKIIAGDVNADERISAIDIVELRKLILGLTEEFQNNDSWRFIDATQVFDNPQKPFPFIEMLSIGNLNKDQMDQDFIGVKIGDVNGNAIANSAIGAGGRNARTLALEISDAQYEAGDQVRVDVASDNFVDMTALQYTIDMDGLEFVGVESGAINVTDANVGLINSRTVTMVWHSDQPVSSDDVLYTLVFNATDNGSLANSLDINSSVTTAASYDSSNEELDVSLNLIQDELVISNNTLKLYQNNPNPFNQETVIGFELPKAGAATITIFDVTGKMVKDYRGEYVKGYNELVINRKELGASGVMYYQLESGSNVATRKMVLLND